MPETITVTKDATTQLVTVEVDITALPQGGTSGQVLIKNGPEDFNYGWQDNPAAALTIPAFDTVADLVASTDSTILAARCFNHDADDHFLSFWITIPTYDHLAPNGTDVVLTAGNVTLARIYSREYAGEDLTDPAPSVEAVNYIEWTKPDNTYLRWSYKSDNTIRVTVGNGTNALPARDWRKPDLSYLRISYDNDNGIQLAVGDGSVDTFDYVVFNKTNDSFVPLGPQLRHRYGDDNMAIVESL